MSKDPTKELPSDSKSTPHLDDDNFGFLVSGIQSLSDDFREVKVRLEALELTVNQRSLETRPIWERALAEIAEVCAELKEVKADLAEVRADLAEVKADLAEVKADLAEVKADLVEVKVELAELRADVAQVKIGLAEVRAELAETKAELREEMKEGFRDLSTKIALLNEDSLTLRADHRRLERRVGALEAETS